MKEATKDRLFELGIRIPRAIEIQDDQDAVEGWAETAIAEAEASAEGAAAALEASAAVASTEDVPDTDLEAHEAAAIMQADGDPGGPRTFTELLETGGVDFDLAELLDGIARTAAELAEVARTEGDDAVNARLGELPAWPEFHAWAETALRVGAVSAAPEHPNPHTPEPEVEVDMSDAPALGSPGLADLSPPARGATVPNDPDPADATHSAEKAAELAAELELREHADAEKRAAAGVEVTSTPHRGEDARAAAAAEAGPRAVPFLTVGDLDTRLVIAEGEIASLASELRGDTRNDLLALSDRLTRLEAEDE